MRRNPVVNRVPRARAAQGVSNGMLLTMNTLIVMTTAMKSMRDCRKRQRIGFLGFGMAMALEGLVEGFQYPVGEGEPLSLGGFDEGVFLGHFYADVDVPLFFG